MPEGPTPRLPRRRRGKGGLSGLKKRIRDTSCKDTKHTEKKNIENEINNSIKILVVFAVLCDNKKYIEKAAKMKKEISSSCNLLEINHKINL